MPEITEIMTHKNKAVQRFTPDTSGPLYVGITAAAGVDDELDSTDGKSSFCTGDNIFIVGAGISIPESFCLSTPQILAGAKLPKINVSIYPDAPGYDPTVSLPVIKKRGDIWRALATANGWIIAHIYRYTGAAWEDITLTDGAVYHHRLYPVTANTTGAFFVPFENFEYILNTFVDIVNGRFYDSAAAAFVTGIKLPYEIRMTIDENTVRISMVNVPATLNTVIQSITPFIKISHNKRVLDLANVND